MAKKIKISAYQKLKANNLQLEQDIYKLLRGEFSEKLSVEMKWKTKFKGDDMIWLGDLNQSNTNCTFDGFISKITNGKKD